MMKKIMGNPPWRQLEERAEKMPGDKKHVEGILSQSQCVAQFNTAQNRLPKRVTASLENVQNEGCGTRILDFGTRSGENPRRFASPTDSSHQRVR